MDTEIVMLIGRILFGGYFLMMGINHFTKKEMLTQYAESRGMKNPGTGIAVSGVFLALGGLSILLGVYVVWGITLLSIFLLLASFKMHAFWKDEGEDKMQNMRYFMTNMALFGALLLICSTYVADWAWALNSVM